MNDEAARQDRPARTTHAEQDSRGARRKPLAAELLEGRVGYFNRGHLGDLGLGRRQVDAVFQTLDVIVFPGTRRPLIRVADYLKLVEESTYGTGRVRSAA
jgi:hypothetical protein